MAVKIKLRPGHKLEVQFVGRAGKVKIDYPSGYDPSVTVQPTGDPILYTDTYQFRKPQPETAPAEEGE